MHLLLNHFPVIGTIIVIALLGAAIVWRNNSLAKTSLGLLAALGAIALMVYFTGEPAEESIEHLPGFSETITERHEEFALAATIALASIGTLALGALLRLRKREIPKWVTVSAFTLSLIAGGMMGYTAMLGGQIRHTEVRPGAVVVDHD
jgi:drug/metabolite transporter (DMT)-like permease